MGLLTLLVGSRCMVDVRFSTGGFDSMYGLMNHLLRSLNVFLDVASCFKSLLFFLSSIKNICCS